MAWNELYLSWIREWIEESAENSHKAHSYSKACASLEGCTKQFNHPSELKELKFFGDRICQQLEKKLRDYCASEGIEMPEKAAPPPTDELPKKKRKAATTRTWVPRYRSGAYAIIIALRKNEHTTAPGEGLKKPEIVALAKDFCDTSFERNPRTHTYHSAWDGIKTLLKHELVYCSSKRGGAYYLTEEGRRIADSLRQVEKENSPDAANRLWTTPVTPDRDHRRPREVSHISSSPLADASTSTLNNNGETLDMSCGVAEWPIGSFTVEVVLDNREVRSKTDRDYFRSELAALDIPVEVRSLAVGDLAWIACHKNTGQKAILDYIVERKRLDDLVSSIKDGRYQEQKFRLHRTSIEHVIYLIEEPPRLETPQAFRQAVHSALSQTVVIDGFYLRRTQGPEETVKYICSMTKTLQNMYRFKPLKVLSPSITCYKQSLQEGREAHRFGYVGIEYDVFSSAMTKSGLTTVRDVYIRMLMTIRGVTWDKAVAIQKKFATPSHLCEAYDALSSESDKKLMLYNTLGDNIQRKRVTKLISERIYEIWGSS
ncbi:crossover junction endonuclease Mus81p [Trichomonascus vanleenenianus]|uniref:Mus81p n=1 Tax=Trichomonascus vanleenenianus TaxID=2268995 RepID=UPI003EC9C9F6